MNTTKSLRDRWRARAFVVTSGADVDDEAVAAIGLGKALDDVDEAVALLKLFSNIAEEFASSDSDMPTFDDTEARFDEALDRVIDFLAEDERR